MLGRFFLGSADVMRRNLFDRIEVIAPIEDRSIKKNLWRQLNLMLSDNRHLWEMNPDGSYTQRQPKTKKLVNSQLELLEGHNAATHR